MNSRIYSGTVSHKRSGKIANEFRYGIYFLLLDLDEVAELSAQFSEFAYNGKAKMSVWDEDHGPHDGSALRPWIEGIVSGVGIDLVGGKVLLLTFPRVAGFKFFPVSFWYCYSADGVLRAVLAEVQNTYRDRHNYLIHASGEPLHLDQSYTHNKVFFVSPFIPIDGISYSFKFTEPGDNLKASIIDIASEGTLLVASIDLQAEPITDESIQRVVRELGPVSFRAQLLIYWQALRLLAKRARFYPHPKPPGEETTT